MNARKVAITPLSDARKPQLQRDRPTRKGHRNRSGDRRVDADAFSHKAISMTKLTNGVQKIASTTNALTDLSVTQANTAVNATSAAQP
jgi:hypothetical protein